MTFKKAIENSKQPLNQAYQPGLKAMGKHSNKVWCARPESRTLTGSVNLDAALARIPEYGSVNRWDYGIGYKPVTGSECAVWIEVHGAKDKEVGTIARKAKWLQEYLKQNSPELWQLTLASPHNLRFVWLGTKSVHLPKNSPEYKRAAMVGVTLHGTDLKLP